MNIDRTTVNQWLADHRRTREWLADHCEVGVRAVGNWLNMKGEARPIPAQHQLTIRRLMEEDQAAAEAKPLQNLVLEFEKADFDQLQAAARKKNEYVTDWAKRTLNEMAKYEVAELHSLVAEEAPAYKTKRTGTRDERGE